MALLALGVGGFFAVYSCIAPLVTDVAGSPDWVVPIVRVVVGLGMTVGNLLGGVLADRNLQRTLLGGIVISIGWGFSAPAWIGAVLALIGLGIATIAYRAERVRVFAAA